LTDLIEQCERRMPKKHPPDAPSGASIEDTILHALESLRAQMDKARQFLVAGEEMDAKLSAVLAGGRAGDDRQRAIDKFPYAGKEVIDAIEDLLDERAHALSRDEIVTTVLARGVFIGKGEYAKGDPAVQVGKSLKYHLMGREEKQAIYPKRIKALDPRLKELNGLIGLPDWPDEKFSP
jgi:hypothetical protein